jgi:hypothetical protein
VGVGYIHAVGRGVEVGAAGALGVQDAAKRTRSRRRGRSFRIAS